MSVLVTGCRHDQQNTRVQELLARHYDHNPSKVNKATTDTLSQVLTGDPALPPQNRPMNLLVISGGGQYAAYNAGLLVGWTERGDRPTFDVVTGISSGAILSASAFLGPKYDPFLQHFFNTASDKTLFEYQPIRALCTTQSLASPSKLEALINYQVNDELMEEMKAAHQKGRRLFIGTMNARTRRLCIWDIGAIACSGRADAKDIVRLVYLAAVSIPGVLPAVKFDIEIDGKRYCEEHIDGGASSQAFLRLCPDAERPNPKSIGWLEGSNLYVMASGKLYAPLLEGRLGFIKRITSVLSASLYALYRAEVKEMYAFCLISGMKFHHSAIPEDARVPKNSTNFETPEMQRMYKMGLEHIRKPDHWRMTPPGYEPGEEESPRIVLDPIKEEMSAATHLKNGALEGGIVPLGMKQAKP